MMMDEARVESRSRWRVTNKNRTLDRLRAWLWECQPKKHDWCDPRSTGKPI